MDLRMEAGRIHQPLHCLSNLGMYCSVTSQQTGCSHNLGISRPYSISWNSRVCHIFINVRSFRWCWSFVVISVFKRLLLYDSVWDDGMVFLWSSSNNCHHLWSCTFFYSVTVQTVGQSVLALIVSGQTLLQGSFEHWWRVGWTSWPTWGILLTYSIATGLI